MRFALARAAALLALATRPGFAAEDHSPSAALASLKLADESLTIELVAAEPDVIDPVCVAWDEDERMYVVEMRDYPLGPGSGTIRRLEDVDGDGRYEKATLYYEGLPFPSSCLPWKGGLLVTAAPDILFLEDTDGDGTADAWRIVLTGFSLGDQQLRVNGLSFGLDGWVYAANGRLGGMIRRPGDPESATVSIARNDVRFKPDTGEFEVIAGPSQFGLAFDDWGNRFLSWNTIPMRHVVIEDRYLARSPGLAGESGLAAVVPPDDIGRIYPLAAPQRRFNRESAEFFNALCGPTVYRGDAIPKLRGDAFVCESLGSLVHHRKLMREGATFTAPRAEEGSEFLASSDPWFRPVNLATGPDGALYVVDFAREWVEHPDYIPEKLREGIDFRAGDDLGRIWRIHRRGAAPNRKRERLRQTTSDELVEALKDANGWRRDWARRLLIGRKNPACAPALAAAAREATLPEARLEALWTLSALESDDAAAALQEAALRASLSDSAPEVRRGALDVLDLCMGDGGGWIEQLELLAEDNDAGVKMRAALTAGRLPKNESFPILTAIASPAMDHWLRLAVVAAAGADAWDFAMALAREEAAGEPAADPQLMEALGRAAGALSDSAASAFMDYCACDGVSRPTWIALLAGFLDGLELRGADWRQTLRPANVPAPREGELVGLDWFVANAAEGIGLDENDPASRARMARVLALADTDKATAAWIKTLRENAPQQVAAEAARLLARAGDASAVSELAESWDRVSSSTRRPLMAGFAGRTQTAAALLQAAEDGKIGLVELRGAAGEALTRHADAAVRERAARLFARDPGDRALAIARLAGAATAPGDARRGAGHFARNCAACHRFQGIGQMVGPDLSGAASRTKEKLISDILDPSAEIAPDYVPHIVVARDGEVLSGLLARETAGAITLRQAQGIETPIAKARIAEFRASELSVMPEGFEDAMDAQGLADLLEFLHQGHRQALEEAMAENAR